MPGPRHAALRRQKAQFPYHVETDPGKAARRSYLVQCCHTWLAVRFWDADMVPERAPFFSWDRMTMKLEQLSVYGFRQSADAAAFKAFVFSLDAMSEAELLALHKSLSAQLTLLRPKEGNPPVINCWVGQSD